MKKKARIALLALVALFVAMPAMAQMSANAKKFQSTSLRYLKNEGYQPYIDEDNDLCFKHEGTTYWITLSDGDDGKPVYVEFHHSGLNIEDANRDEVLQTANYINLNKKCVKASMSSKSLVFTIEMLFFDANDFTPTIPRCIDLLSSSYDDAKEYYRDL